MVTLRPSAAGFERCPVRDKLHVSERRICRVLGQHRSTQRHRPRGRSDEERLVSFIHSRG
ncbi:MAG: hypothetical protein HOD33_01170 [Acidiferrobacteraceae bacterium]|nr:hypothetical protein [Acidiferrobacteraceae bacterium]